MLRHGCWKLRQALNRMPDIDIGVLTTPHSLFYILLFFRPYRVALVALLSDTSNRENAAHVRRMVDAWHTTGFLVAHSVRWCNITCFPFQLLVGFFIVMSAAVVVFFIVKSAAVFLFLSGIMIMSYLAHDVLRGLQGAQLTATQEALGSVDAAPSRLCQGLSFRTRPTNSDKGVTPRKRHNIPPGLGKAKNK